MIKKRICFNELAEEKKMASWQMKNITGGSLRCILEDGRCILTNALDCWLAGGLLDGIGGC
jgi:hypothetical protein